MLATRLGMVWRLRVNLLVDLAPVSIKSRQMNNAKFVGHERKCGSYDADPVFDAAFQVDRRCFFEVLGRAGVFAFSVSVLLGLRDHLVVKNEVVGVLENG